MDSKALENLPKKDGGIVKRPGQPGAACGHGSEHMDRMRIRQRAPKVFLEAKSYREISYLLHLFVQIGNVPVSSPCQATNGHVQEGTGREPILL